MRLYIYTTILFFLLQNIFLSGKSTEIVYLKAHLAPQTQFRGKLPALDPRFIHSPLFKDFLKTVKEQLLSLSKKDISNSTFQIGTQEYSFSRSPQALKDKNGTVTAYKIFLTVKDSNHRKSLFPVLLLTGQGEVSDLSELEELSSLESQHLLNNGYHLPRLGPKYSFDSLLEAWPTHSKWTQEKNVLFFTPQRDEFLLFLQEIARVQEENFLHVSLSSEEDLEELLEGIRIEEDGSTVIFSGAQKQIIQEGGVLFLDVAGSHPKYLAAYNKILDGVIRESAHPNLRIVGVLDTVLDENGGQKLANDFFSRAIKFKPPKINMELKYPIEEYQPSLNDTPYQAHLYHSPNFKEKLLGKYFLNEKGRLEVHKGPLLEAIENDQALVISSANWEDPTFKDFIHQIFHTGKVTFNGTDYFIGPGFKILRQDDFNLSENIENKTLSSIDNESLKAKQPWLINESNAEALLFQITQINEETGKLTQHKGIFSLEENKTTHLLIKESLPDWIWHEIFHLPFTIQIHTHSGVQVPDAYQHLIKSPLATLPSSEVVELEKGIDALNSEKTSEYKVVSEPVTLVEGDNLSGWSEVLLVLPTLESSPHPLTFSVRHESQIEDLFGSPQIKGKDADNLPLLEFQETAYLNYLKMGGEIIIDGLENNEVLRSELMTLFAPEPYLLINGKRHFFGQEPGQLKGKIILLNRGKPIDANQKVHFKTFPFPDRSYHSWTRETQKVLPQLLKLLKTPEINELLPLNHDQISNRISLLFQRTDSLLKASPEADLAVVFYKALEDIFIESLRENPQAYLYAKTHLRKMVLTEFSRHTGRLPQLSPLPPNTIDINKVFQVLDTTVEPNTPGDRTFDLLDAFSDDLLNKIALPKKSSSTSLSPLLNSLIGHAMKNTNFRTENRTAQEIKFLHQALYGAKQEDSLAPDFAQSPVFHQQAAINRWREQEFKARNLLDQFGAIFLQGSPGVGKSYFSEDILAKKLGYSKGNPRAPLWGPVTTGKQSTQEELIGFRKINQNKEGVFEPGVIARWAGFNEDGTFNSKNNNQGGLLIIDEANLTNPDFWNFFQSFFTPNPHLVIDGKTIPLNKKHKIIFTGNQTALEGRNTIDLFQSHVPTVFFDAFNENFLSDQVNQYLRQEFNQQNPSYEGDVTETLKNISSKMVDIHLKVSRIAPDKVLSLRDLQEFASRIPLTDLENFTPTLIAFHAFDLYGGLLSPNERKALVVTFQGMFGFDFPEQYDNWVMNSERSGFSSFLQGWQKDQAKKEVGKKFILPKTSLHLLHRIHEFTQVRERRLSFETQLQGKRGMIFEGPSARGKDEMILRFLEKQGFINVLNENGQLRKDIDIDKIPPQKRLYHIIGNPDYEKDFHWIQVAKEDGSMLLYSELNVLPTGILEGKLNDLLTGAANESFAFFGTKNSSSFSGRENFSSALQNRLIFERVDDYTQDELLEIAKGQSESLAQENLKKVVNTHSWLREEILAQGFNLVPTTRELLKTIQMLQEGKKVEEVIEDVYGHFHLRIMLQKDAWPWEIIESFREKPSFDTQEVLRTYAQAIAPKREKPLEVEWVSGLDNGGEYHPSSHRVLLNIPQGAKDMDVGRLFLKDLRTLDHEVGHGLVTRSNYSTERHKGLFKDPESLYMWLEDMRQERAFERLTSIQLEERISDDLFVHAMVSHDLEYLSKMRQRDLFKYLLSTFAQGKLSLKTIDENIRHIMKLPKDSTLYHRLYPAFYYARTSPSPDKPFAIYYAKEIYSLTPRSLRERDVQFAQYRSNDLILQLQEVFLKLPYEELEDKESSTQEEALEALEKLSNFDPSRLSNDVVKSSQKELKEALIQKAKENEETPPDMDIQGFLLQLKQIENDLTKPELSQERLQEINQMLSQDLHERTQWKGSLVPFLRKFGDIPELRLQTRLKAIHAELVKRNQKAETQVIKKKEQKGLIHRQYAPPRTHRKKTSNTEKIIRRPRPKKASAQKVTLLQKESDLRSPYRRSVSQHFMGQLEAQSAKSPLYSTESGVGHRWSKTQGIPYFPRLLKGRLDAFRQGGLQSTRVPKEIILRAGPHEWTPLLEDIVNSLLQIDRGNAFSFTVYYGDNRYVEGIKTLSQLKSYLGKESQLDEEVIRKDLMKRKNSSQIWTKGLEELQTLLESDFLYSAFTADLEKAKGENGSSQILSKEDQLKADEKELMDFIEKYGLKGNSALRPNGNGFTLHLSSSLPAHAYHEIPNVPSLVGLELFQARLQDISFLTDYPQLEELDLGMNPIQDFSPLGQLANLKSIRLIGTPIRDLSPLLSQPELNSVVLSDTPYITEDAMKQFIVQHFLLHPNGPALSVSGNNFWFQDVECKINEIKDEIYLQSFNRNINYKIEDFKQKQLAFKTRWQNNHIRGLLNQIGLPLSVISFNDQAKGFNLNLEGVTNFDFNQLAVLAQFDLIKHITLADSSVSDISFLKGFTSLETVILRNTQVSSLTPLFELPLIDHLNLRGLKIDPSEVKEFVIKYFSRYLYSRISALSLFPPQKSDFDYESLSLRATPTLDGLQIDQSDLVSSSEDTTFYEGPTLGENDKTSFGQEKKIHSVMRRLSLDESLLSKRKDGTFKLDLSGQNLFSPSGILIIQSLGDLDLLQELDLRGARFKDLSFLESFSSLKTLHLGNTILPSLSPLEKLSLEELTLESIDIRDNLQSSPLGNIKTLKTLHLNKVLFEDLSFLPHLNFLETLKVSHCEHIDEYGSIGLVKSLKHLDLEGAKLSDISFLEDLPILKALSLKDCPNIYDYSPIFTLKELKKLDLFGAGHFDELGIKDFLGRYFYHNLSNQLELVWPFPSPPIKSDSFWKEQTKVINRGTSPSYTLQVNAKRNDIDTVVYFSSPEFTHQELYRFPEPTQTMNVKDIQKTVNFQKLNDYLKKHLPFSVLRYNTMTEEVTLELRSNTPLSAEQIRQLNSFQVIDRLVVEDGILPNLESLTQLTTLKNLKLHNLKTSTDFTILSSIQTLKHLELDSESNLLPKSAIQSLVHLSNIESLRLSNLSIDLKELPQMTNLEKLEINKIPISNYGSFLKFPNLKTLKLASIPNAGQASIAFIDELGQLKHLEDLFINQCAFQDLNFVTNIPTLKKLHLINLRTIFDFSPLQTCPNLSFLQLSNVSNLHSFPLSGSTTLKEVHLSGQDSMILEGLEKVSSLESAHFKGDRIQDSEIDLFLKKFFGFHSKSRLMVNRKDSSTEGYFTQGNNIIKEDEQGVKSKWGTFSPQGKSSTPSDRASLIALYISHLNRPLESFEAVIRKILNGGKQAELNQLLKEIESKVSPEKRHFIHQCIDENIKKNPTQTSL